MSPGSGSRAQPNLLGLNLFYTGADISQRSLSTIPRVNPKANIPTAIIKVLSHHVLNKQTHRLREQTHAPQPHLEHSSYIPRVAPSHSQPRLRISTPLEESPTPPKLHTHPPPPTQPQQWHPKQPPKSPARQSQPPRPGRPSKGTSTSPPSERAPIPSFPLPNPPPLWQADSPADTTPPPPGACETSSLDKSVLSKTDTSTYCPWKGHASYYTLNVNGSSSPLRLLSPHDITHMTCRAGTSTDEALHAAGKEIKDAAWYYPEPFEKAKHIKDYVAFCEYCDGCVGVHGWVLMGCR